MSPFSDLSLCTGGTTSHQPLNDPQSDDDTRRQDRPNEWFKNTAIILGLVIFKITLNAALKSAICRK